jgi:hypothetical protein
MAGSIFRSQELHPSGKSLISDRLLLAGSAILQVVLGLTLGHAYDMRIFMATGYLVGTGQNPYIAQDLSSVFLNSTFQGITSFGYPPPWSLMLGLIYLVTYRILPNFLLYNLAIKLPLIAANLCLAALVARILERLGASKETCRRAWIFMLFNPMLLAFSSAWGQFDGLVALLSLWSIYLLSERKLICPAVLLALAIACKPVALPMLAVVFVYLAGKSLKKSVLFFAIFSAGMVFFCLGPFALFGWSLATILEHWNFHLTVGGGLSFMTLLKTWDQSYQLGGSWQIMGWVWVPALGIATWQLRPGIDGLRELIKGSTALLLVFYLWRAWVSEPNILLVLPMVLILACVNELKPISLVAMWVLPLVFGFFNTSLAQLFFPGTPGVMKALLKLAVEFNPARYIMLSIVVVAWLAAGWWIILQCFGKHLVTRGKSIPS